MNIGKRTIGAGHPIYIIAELSGNHNQSFERAVAIVRCAKEAGADAVKLQTYTADTITLDCDNDYFRIKGTVWDGATLHQLYRDASTPWDWQPRLRSAIEDLGMDFISSPFDSTAVQFLESIGVAAYKVASSEIIDMPLLRRIAATGKPVIVSTGMATLEEIDEAVRTLREGGARDIVLLKCTASYPAPVEDMNLRTIPSMKELFGLEVGLSDHSMSIEVPVAAAALGASAIEKHLTLARSDGGPDSAFSLEPAEFKAMVSAVRRAQQAMGEVHYGPAASEHIPRIYRRSLFVVTDMRAGDVFSEANVRSIRPGHGLHTRHLSEVLGRRASRDIVRGTPLGWDLVA